MAEKQQQIADWTAQVTDKEGQKAEKSTMLSENEELLAATQAQLKVDEDFFATARDSCKAKSDEWDERQRLRTEQLDGINKALEILTSDEARKTFSASTSVRAQDTFGTEGSREMDSTEVTKMSVGDVFFLQTDAEKMPQNRAYSVLKNVIGDSKNLRLARIAVAVRTASKGHFDEVIAEIDRMIELLGEESQEDIEQRDWCIAEQNNQTNHKENLEYDISQLQAKITMAEKKKAELEAEKEDTLKKKADLEEAMEEALADREAENQAFTGAKTDDENAIELLGQAIEALSAYGDNNDVLLQRRQPAMEVSEDQAPDATFSGKGNYKDAQGGIIALLTQIKENLEIEIKTGLAAEAKATEEYLKLRADADAQIKSYEEQVVALDAAISDTDAEITSLTETKEDTEAEHKTTVDYLAKIEPNCEWIKASFYKRAELRTEEADGLREAQAILAGAEGGEFGFLQSVH